MSFYNTTSSGRMATRPGAGGSFGTGTRGGDQPGKKYENHDGPGGTTVDYGPHNGPNERDQEDADRKKYGDSPWYGRNGSATPMPWSGAPDLGNVGGQRTPFYTPDAGDPRNAGYYIADDPAKDAAWNDQHAQNLQARQAAFAANPEYQAALKARDFHGMIAAMQKMSHQAQADRFIAGGGTQDTWNHRFEHAWPTPTMADGTRAPGAPATGGGGMLSPTPPPDAPPPIPPPVTNPDMTNQENLAHQQGKGDMMEMINRNRAKAGLPPL